MNAGLLGCCQDPVNQLFVMKCYSEEGRRPGGVWRGWDTEQRLSKEKKKKKADEQIPATAAEGEMLLPCVSAH